MLTPGSPSIAVFRAAWLTTFSMSAPETKRLCFEKIWPVPGGGGLLLGGMGDGVRGIVFHMNTQHNPSINGGPS